MLDASVSTIICTLDRCNSLRKVMSAISSWRSAFQELIVVVGPSQDETKLVLSEYRHIIDRIIFTYERNVSVARNLGLRAASCHIVIYLDDDVIPPENWINLHLKAY